MARNKLFIMVAGSLTRDTTTQLLLLLLLLILGAATTIVTAFINGSKTAITTTATITEAIATAAHFNKFKYSGNRAYFRPSKYNWLYQNGCL